MERMKGVKIHETSLTATRLVSPGTWARPAREPGTGLSLGIRFRNEGQDQQHQQVNHHVMFMRVVPCASCILVSGSWCSH